ncbi:MAG: hypothetical protein HKN70_08785, partial [Gammaproteobacteria bacterium]|nr:hypothetical protein [Gammaproteobacteria bacterium]
MNQTGFCLALIPMLLSVAVGAAQDDVVETTTPEPTLAAEAADLQAYLDKTKSMTASFDSVLLDAQMRESGASTGTV